MKKLILILLLVVSVYLLILEHGSIIKDYISTPEKREQLATRAIQAMKEPPKPPFEAGESFKYSYSMGPLKVGSATLTFVGETTLDDEKVYHITFESKVGTFYDFENIYAEPETLYPLYVERKIKNIGFTTVIKEKYDQDNFKVDITKKGITGEYTKTITKQAPIQNALLLLYYCRTLSEAKLKPGLEFDVVLPVDEFKVKLSKIEELKTPAGNFKAYFFESTPEKMKLWIATNKERTPLKVQNSTAIGPSSIILVK